LATEKAVVFLSTMFNILWSTVGLARVGVAKEADWQRTRQGQTERAGETRRTYSGREKAFILHTNCFAEHFVFE